MSFYSVDILTPSAIVAKDLPAETLFVPTARGQIEILPSHTHIIENLGTGILTVKNAEGDVSNFSITTGICKLLDDKIHILANVCEKEEVVDLERAEKALSFATDKLENDETLEDEEFTKYSRKIERAKMRIELCKLNK